MYKIIGTDGKEYGPVAAEQVRLWLGEGRINSQSKVRAEGSTEWQTLSALPEFASAASKPPGPPPLPLAAPTAPAKISGLAVTSLVLGILGLFTCGITALVGLVFGIIALAKIKNSQGRLSGLGLAISGTAVSALFLMMVPIFAAMLLPALAKAKERAQSIQCVSNMKQLCLAATLYAEGHGGKLPPTTNWCDTMQTIAGSARIFQCPSAGRPSRSDYAFNAKLADLSTKRISDPATTVLFFESGGGWNLSGGPELMIKPSRHRRMMIVGFADGHVEQMPESRLNELRWDP